MDHFFSEKRLLEIQAVMRRVGKSVYCMQPGIPGGRCSAQGLWQLRGIRLWAAFWPRKLLHRLILSLVLASAFFVGKRWRGPTRPMLPANSVAVWLRVPYLFLSFEITSLVGPRK